MLDPLEIFARHGLADGLTVHGLSRSNFGLNNAVWLSDDLVLRVANHGNDTDHVREAKLALHALEIGIRTARPLHWTRAYSIWERLHGSTVRAPQPARVWEALLDDLERLRANPPEPAPSLETWTAKPFPWDRVPSAPGTWDGDLRLLETAFAAQLTPLEKKRLERAFAPRSLEKLHFLHADAFSANVVAGDGEYVGLIDWGNAQWHTVEREFAWMEDDALALALGRYDLNLGLLYAMRAELLLKVGEIGHATLQDVRGALRHLS
jgi:aminoglycoside phosphotransferase